MLTDELPMRVTNEFFAHVLHMRSYVCLLQKMMMLSTLEMQIYDYKTFYVLYTIW